MVLFHSQIQSHMINQIMLKLACLATVTEASQNIEFFVCGMSGYDAYQGE